MKTTTMRQDTLQRPRNLEAILSWTKQVCTNWNKTALYHTTQMCIMCAFETDKASYLCASILATFFSSYCDN